MIYYSTQSDDLLWYLVFAWKTVRKNLNNRIKYKVPPHFQWSEQIFSKMFVAEFLEVFQSKAGAKKKLGVKLNFQGLSYSFTAYPFILRIFKPVFLKVLESFKLQLQGFKDEKSLESFRWLLAVLDFAWKTKKMKEN